jgi:hypothetical protein
MKIAKHQGIARPRREPLSKSPPLSSSHLSATEPRTPSEASGFFRQLNASLMIYASIRPYSNWVS